MPALENTPDPSLKFDCLINRLSGTVLNEGEEKILSGLQEAMGERLGAVTFVDGRDVAASVRSWAGAPHDGRSLIIGGGDGTVLTAASEIMGREDVVLGVLPLGTHNLFARQLGFAADFRKAAQQVAKSRPAAVDVGNVNGRNFLCGLMIDENSVNFFAAREDLRVKKRMSALRRIFNAVTGVFLRRPKTLAVAAGGVTADVKGRVFSVTNNLLSPLPVGRQEGAAGFVKGVVERFFNKGDQNDGHLGLYAVEGGMIGVPRATIAALHGNWTKAKGVSVTVAPEMVISQKDGTASATTIMLDGEATAAHYPLRVKLIRSGLRVLKPA